MTRNPLTDRPGVMARETGAGAGSNCPWACAMPGQLVATRQGLTRHAAHCRRHGLVRFLQGFPQLEVPQGHAGSRLLTNAMGWARTGRASRRAIRKSSESVPAQTDSRCVNRAVPVGVCVQILLVLCLSQMELMVELHVDRRRDRAVTRMEKLPLELPS